MAKEIKITLTDETFEALRNLTGAQVALFARALLDVRRLPRKTRLGTSPSKTGTPYRWNTGSWTAPGSERGSRLVATTTVSPACSRGETANNR